MCLIVTSVCQHTNLSAPCVSRGLYRGPRYGGWTFWRSDWHRRVWTTLCLVSRAWVDLSHCSADGCFTEKGSSLQMLNLVSSILRVAVVALFLLVYSGLETILRIRKWERWWWQSELVKSVKKHSRETSSILAETCISGEKPCFCLFACLYMFVYTSVSLANACWHSVQPRVSHFYLITPNLIRG